MFAQAKLDYAARNPSQDNGRFHNDEMAHQIEENKGDVALANTPQLLAKIDEITSERK